MYPQINIKISFEPLFICTTSPHFCFIFGMEIECQFRTYSKYKSFSKSPIVDHTNFNYSPYEYIHYGTDYFFSPYVINSVYPQLKVQISCTDVLMRMFFFFRLEKFSSLKKMEIRIELGNKTKMVNNKKEKVNEKDAFT